MSTQRSTHSILDNIAFFSMARHLGNDAGFPYWLAKLWDFDPGLLIKFMRANTGRFDAERIMIYNEHLSHFHRERFRL